MVDEGDASDEAASGQHSLTTLKSLLNLHQRGVVKARYRAGNKARRQPMIITLNATRQAFFQRLVGTADDVEGAWRRLLWVTLEDDLITAAALARLRQDRAPSPSLSCHAPAASAVGTISHQLCTVCPIAVLLLLNSFLCSGLLIQDTDDVLEWGRSVARRHG